MAESELTNRNDLGLFNSKATNWLVSYHSGWSAVVGEHTCIFYSAESLTIAVAQIRGFGPSVSRGVRAGKGRPQTGKKGGGKDPLEKKEDIINNTDDAEDERDLEDADSAKELYKFILNNGSPVVGKRPFSLLDLSSARGEIRGFNVDVVVAGAQVYWIEAFNLFDSQNVYNVDPGSVGAGMGILTGWWSVSRYYSIYHEWSHGKSGEDRPFRNLVGSPRWIRELPPAGW